MKIPKRYHPVLVTLHWLTVILMFGAGFLAEDSGYSPVNIHMLFGALLFIVLTARLIVRFSFARPAPVDAGNAFFNKIGELTHLGLYAGGFFILAMGGLVAYNRNLIGYLLGNGPVSRPGFEAALHHLGWLMAFALILLHVGAALYHQFILNDNLMSRMWYGKQ
ncbi:MAG: cytochrome b [Anaerolineales bacterium]